MLEGADPNSPRQLETVEQVLEDIGATDQPRLLVLNKIDRLHETVRDGLLPSETLEAWLDANPDAMAVSAKSGEGLEVLKTRILGEVRGELREVTVKLPLAEAKLIDRLEILTRRWTNSGPNPSLGVNLEFHRTSLCTPAESGFTRGVRASAP